MFYLIHKIRYCPIDMAVDKYMFFQYYSQSFALKYPKITQDIHKVVDNFLHEKTLATRYLQGFERLTIFLSPIYPLFCGYFYVLSTGCQYNLTSCHALTNYNIIHRSFKFHAYIQSLNRMSYCTYGNYINSGSSHILNIVKGNIS